MHGTSSWGDLHFGVNERFLYEYDFGDLWQHQVRIENGWKLRPAGPIRCAWEADGLGHRRIAGDRKRLWSGARLRRGESESCLMTYWKTSKPAAQTA